MNLISYDTFTKLNKKIMLVKDFFFLLRNERKENEIKTGIKI